MESNTPLFTLILQMQKSKASSAFFILLSGTLGQVISLLVGAIGMGVFIHL